MNNSVPIIFFLAGWLSAQAQFHPPAGVTGTSAMHADSSAFVAWANSCIVTRGPQQINLADSELSTAGNDTSAIGKAGTAGVVSLGDGGSAVLGFENAIINGEGWDFAVFENSFDGLFLELAFVEVSSDGIYYARFPATCLNDSSTVIGTYENADARMYNNLAGKYRVMYGVPFDLEELADDPGIDVNWIKFVRVTDVIGSNATSWCSRDQFGNPVIDPFPTPFISGGFDLDAVGVIHQSDPNLLNEVSNDFIQIFPQPASAILNIRLGKTELQFPAIHVFDLSGRELQTEIISYDAGVIKLNTGALKQGFYYLVIKNKDAEITSKFVIAR
ncbi:MAG: T9SS type A sorting domain-containing protein [Bacteroidetes bacterium]|nr:T9SS type A sorting domain-containing protein [Bacteroidota bacterium]